MQRDSSKNAASQELDEAERAVSQAARSLDRDELDRAARLLEEEAAMPADALRRLRIELGEAYLRRKERRWSLVAAKTLAPVGGPTGCAMGATILVVEQPIDAGKAHDLLAAAGMEGEAAWAAYHAGNLPQFEQATQHRDLALEERLLRLRLLAHAGRQDDALAEAERIAATAGPPRSCGAWLVAGSLRERRREHAAARDAYVRARDAEPLDACGRGAQARLTALDGLSDGEPMPVATVRGTVTVPASGEVLVALVADPIDGRSVVLPTEPPADWRSIDRYVAMPGRVEGGQFEIAGVPRGEWTLMVLVEDGTRYRTSPAGCWHSVRVHDAPVDAGQITIVEDS